MRPETLGTQRYFAWLYSPPPLQGCLAILLELEREICASARAPLEHEVAHARLEWWRGECARARSGSAAHPLTRSLTARSAHAPPDLTGLVDIATWDLACATFATRTELAGYCARWAAALTEPAARLAAAPGAQARAAEFGRTLGIALKEIELITELHLEAHRGRLRVPLDELAAAAIDTASLGRPPWGEALGELLAQRLRTLRGELAASIGRLTAAERTPLRGLIVWGALAARHAHRTEGALPDAWRPGGASRLADAWHSWRAARQAS